MVKYKNMYLNVDGCVYRGIKDIVNIIYSFLFMDGSFLELAMRWDRFVVKFKVVRFRG